MAVKEDLRLGLVGPSLARQLTRLPAGNQEALLALTRRETLTAQEVSGVIDLLQGASQEQAAFVLQKPREALALTQGMPQALRDPRLSRAGNWLAKYLAQALEALVRVENWLRTPNERELRAQRSGDRAAAVGACRRSGRRGRGTGAGSRPQTREDAMTEKMRLEIVQRRQSGMSLRAIAEELGISRGAVYRVLMRVQAQRDGCAALTLRAARRGSIVDAFEPLLKELLTKYPNLTVERALQELRARGYTGGYTVRASARAASASASHAGPRAAF